MKWTLLIALLFTAAPALAVELTLEDISNAKGDGPDGKGNTEDDTWNFWFELAHKPGAFERLSTHSTLVAKDGIPKKLRGPIASSLPSPMDTDGWVFHRDWDGRFEGVWADKKVKQILVHPYVEKVAHMGVAITYKVPADGNYKVELEVTDLQISKGKTADGISWRLERVQSKDKFKSIGTGGPIGDENPKSSDKASFDKVELLKGDLVRLVISPNKHWGADLTRIDHFKIELLKK